MADPELLADAARQGLEIEPIAGQDIEKLVDGPYRVPSAVIDHVRRINAGKWLASAGRFKISGWRRRN